MVQKTIWSLAISSAETPSASSRSCRWSNLCWANPRPFSCFPDRPMNPDNIRIVLVHTTHPGTIGGVARAMKNMGLHRLYLVAPDARRRDYRLSVCGGYQCPRAPYTLAPAGCSTVCSASGRSIRCRAGRGRLWARGPWPHQRGAEAVQFAPQYSDIQ